MSFVFNHFSEKGHSVEEVKLIVDKYDSWYGIVDGLHHNMAVRWLKEHKDSWSSSLWYVTVLKGGFSVEHYQKLSRFQNHRHSAKYFVEVTFFDQLNNLRRDYERFRLRKPSVSQKQVAQSYFGTQTVNRTMTMTASLAIRLPKLVLRELGIIMNTERPDMYIAETSLDAYGAKTEEDIISMRD